MNHVVEPIAGFEPGQMGMIRVARCLVLRHRPVEDDQPDPFVPGRGLFKLLGKQAKCLLRRQGQGVATGAWRVSDEGLGQFPVVVVAGEKGKLVVVNDGATVP